MDNTNRIDSTAEAKSQLEKALLPRNLWHVQNSSIEHNLEGGTATNSKHHWRDLAEAGPSWYQESVWRLLQSAS